MSRRFPAAYDDLVIDERGRTYYRAAGEIEGKPYRVCWWWDHATRFWVVYIVDAEDQQIGGSQYVHRSSVSAQVDHMVYQVGKAEHAWSLM